MISEEIYSITIFYNDKLIKNNTNIKYISYTNALDDF